MMSCSLALFGGLFPDSTDARQIAPAVTCPKFLADFDSAAAAFANRHHVPGAHPLSDNARGIRFLAFESFP